MADPAQKAYRAVYNILYANLRRLDPDRLSKAQTLSRDTYTATYASLARADGVDLAALPPDSARQAADAQARQFAAWLESQQLKTEATVRKHAPGGTDPATVDRLVAIARGIPSNRVGVLMRYRQEMIDAGGRPATVERRLAARAASYRRERAVVWARSESSRWREDAKRRFYEAAVEAGQSNVNAVRWVSHPKASTCPSCRAMGANGGTVVALGEAFLVPGYGAVEGPPLHPLCGCEAAYFYRKPTRKPGRVARAVGRVRQLFRGRGSRG